MIKCVELGDMIMADIQQLLKETVEDLERLLDVKHVLGEPIERGDATVIPLVSLGFGFGAGGGEDAKSGSGGGTGAGGGVKPVGAIVIEDGAVRVESAKSGMSGAFEAMAECCAKMMERKMASKKGVEGEDGGECCPAS